MAAMEIMMPAPVPEKEPEAPGLPDIAAGMLDAPISRNLHENRTANHETTDSNAVLKDKVASWRYGRAPDYTKTRAYWQE